METDRLQANLGPAAESLPVEDPAVRTVAEAARSEQGQNGYPSRPVNANGALRRRSKIHM